MITLKNVSRPSQMLVSVSSQNLSDNSTSNVYHMDEQYGRYTQQQHTTLVIQMENLLLEKPVKTIQLVL